MPAEPDEREALESWLSERSGPPRADTSCRGAARSGAFSILRTETPRWPTRRASTQTTAVQHDALETLQAVLALPALPRRIECFDISTIQGSETVASMVVCEDGRMRRGDYRKFRIRGLAVPPSGSNRREPRSDEGGLKPARDDRQNDDLAAMHEVVLRRYRTLLEQGGPFPDLVLIDGGEGPVVGRLRGARGTGSRQPGGRRASRRRRKLLFTRDRVDPHRARAERPGAAARPADSRRSAPLRRDVPSATRGRCAICGQSSTRCRASARGAGGRC